MAKLALVRLEDLPTPVKKSVLPGRRECINLVRGDITVATLLSQIIWWCLPNSKTGKMKGGVKCSLDGNRYIAKTREEWMQETGLTLKRYKRAVSVLKDLGLIEVRIMQFQRLTQTHIRLCRDVLQVMLTESTRGARAGLPRGPERWSLSDRSRDTESTSESTSESIFSVNSVHTDETLQTEPGIDQEKTEEGQVPMKATEILAQHQTKKVAGTDQTIVNFWISRHALVFGESHVVHLNGKERGQLGLLKRFTGMDQAKAIIAYVVEEWPIFSQHAGEDAGTLYPKTPHIGFVLKHYPMALSLLAQKQSQKGLYKPTTVLSLPPTKMIPVQSSAEPAFEKTPESLTAFLSELDELKSP